MVVVTIQNTSLEVNSYRLMAWALIPSILLSLLYKNIITTHEIISAGFLSTGNMEGIHAHDAIHLQFKGSASNVIIPVDESR
jgi:hypothetical protein